MNALRTGLLTVLLASTAAAIPASAHHSAAGMDMTRTLTVSGVLKEFDWGAPHAQITIIVDQKGVPTKVTAGTLAPTQITGQGFKPKDLRAGQKVEMAYHPHREHDTSGIMVSLKLEDGRVMSGGDAGIPGLGGPPGAAPGAAAGGYGVPPASR